MLNISISLFSLRAVPSISQSYHKLIVSFGSLIAPLKINCNWSSLKLHCSNNSEIFTHSSGLVHVVMEWNVQVLLKPNAVTIKCLILITMYFS